MVALGIIGSYCAFTNDHQIQNLIVNWYISEHLIYRLISIGF